MHNTAQTTLISNGKIIQKCVNSRPPAHPLAAAIAHRYDKNSISIHGDLHRYPYLRQAW